MSRSNTIYFRAFSPQKILKNHKKWIREMQKFNCYDIFTQSFKYLALHHCIFILCIFFYAKKSNLNALSSSQENYNNRNQLLNENNLIKRFKKNPKIMLLCPLVRQADIKYVLLRTSDLDFERSCKHFKAYCSPLPLS